MDPNTLTSGRTHTPPDEPLARRLNEGRRMVFPKAVLVISPLDYSVLNQSWLFEFLSGILPLGLKSHELQTCLAFWQRYIDDGMTLCIRARTPEALVHDATHCEEAVRLAFPRLTSLLHMLRYAFVFDFLHSNVPTAIAWILPPIPPDFPADAASKIDCTLRNEKHGLVQIGQIEVCAKSVPNGKNPDPCTAKCIHNLPELIAVQVMHKCLGRTVAMEKAKALALQTGSRDYAAVGNGIERRDM